MCMLVFSRPVLLLLSALGTVRAVTQSLLRTINMGGEAGGREGKIKRARDFVTKIRY